MPDDDYSLANSSFTNTGESRPDYRFSLTEVYQALMLERAIAEKLAAKMTQPVTVDDPRLLSYQNSRQRAEALFELHNEMSGATSE